MLTTNYALLTTHKDRLLVERFDKRHFCYMADHIQLKFSGEEDRLFERVDKLIHFLMPLTQIAVVFGVRHER